MITKPEIDSGTAFDWGKLPEIMPYIVLDTRRRFIPYSRQLVLAHPVKTFWI